MKTRKHICHPKMKTKKKCINDQILIKLRNTWNKRHPDKIIKTDDPNKIKLKLKKYNSICNNEICLVENIDKKLRDKIFAPFQPLTWRHNKNTWLNSLDILNVMKQYEESHKNFLFLGPAPIDFDMKMENRCVWNELCMFDISQIQTTKNKIGIIFNLDPHYKRGSHWVCIFIDLKNSYILYFDSVGSKIPPEIEVFKNKILKSCNGNLKYYDNEGITHQKKNTECGMYCLYTIISLLTDNKKVHYFLKPGISDDYVEKYRNIYFNAPYK